MRNSHLSLVSFNALNRALIEELNFIRTKPGEYYEKLLNWNKHVKDNLLLLKDKNSIKLPDQNAIGRLLNIFLDRVPINPLEQTSLLEKTSEETLSAIEESSKALIDVKPKSSDDLLKAMKNYSDDSGTINELICKSFNDPHLIVLQLLFDEYSLSVILNESYRYIGISSKYIEKYDELITILNFSDKSFSKRTKSLVKESEIKVAHSEAPLEKIGPVLPNFLTQLDNSVINSKEVLDYRISKDIIRTKSGRKVLITKYIQYIDGTSEEWIIKQNI